MHKEYGKLYGHTCSECHNLAKYYNESRFWYKCKVYGNTRSESTDWAKRNIACGMFDKPFNPEKQIPLIEKLKRSSKQAENEPIEGQLILEVE